MKRNADTSMASHFFQEVPLAPIDPVFWTKNAFNADKHPNKINLGIGAYRTNEGKPWTLSCVEKAKAIITKQNGNHEYLDISGMEELCRCSQDLVFGTEFTSAQRGRIGSVQTLSGTGSLRVAAEFLACFLKNKLIFVSNPTWGNHNAVFQKAGLEPKAYRYLNSKTLGLDYEGMIADLQAAPDRSIICLHACAHNPTGIDPTEQQWQGIADVIRQKDHLPFFDMAYQGFASGSLEKDSYAIRLFTSRGFELVCSQSFAKNFGLYGERVGALHVLTTTEDRAKAVVSQINLVIRPNYSNPPTFGARIVTTVLSTPELYVEWKQNLTTMSGRIGQVRQLLFDELKKLGTPGRWNHILEQIGMFTYTGLNEKQCERLINEFHVYLLKSGRISMAGINTGNVAYLAQAIHAVVTDAPAKL